EKKIAEKVGVKHALFVCNGTAALKLGLVGLGIKAGDEVVMPSFTFIATIEAILELGATPVIAEVDKSLNMDPKDLEKKISKKTMAIIPVHMAGVPARMEEILAIAKKKNLPVLEDSAQAFGATYKGKYLGTLGNAGIYSTDIGKIITTGEGGLLVTNEEKIYLMAREYSDHGHEQNPKFPRGEDTRTIWGFNYKVTEMQGAVGLAQLKKLDFILEAQRKNKKRIKDALKGIKKIEFRELPDDKGDAADTLIFFVESKEKALKLAAALKAKGLGTKNLPDAINWHYAGTWDHIFKGYKKNLEEVWSQSTGFLRRSIALPIMVNMSEDRINEVIVKVNESIKEVL
ncbi:MAG: DegT/DnrJ/EryC1/StrS family aminotransferase, partial [Candidatus Omnitrophica bacterium]|nr:DegT/DnrJ/EryC1/StrS family aminotransferase [Candidatus Omnitrophota bacterium]